MPGDRITCREFVEFVGDYHDGELPAAQCRLFEAHLTECQKCRDYLKAYRTTIRLAKAAMEDLIEQAVPEELVKAILLSARSQRK
jgi:anti-sigma factor RsiW